MWSLEIVEMTVILLSLFIVITPLSPTQLILTLSDFINWAVRTIQITSRGLPTVWVPDWLLCSSTV